nr:MAG: hypothetical protein [Microvirus sp.]
MAKFRKKLSRKGSKRLFSKTAKRVNKKNVRPMVMRGGIRF